MSKHYLAIQHESYDSSTVYGVFDTFFAARDHLESEAADPDSYSSASSARIEEWKGPEHVTSWERKWNAPKIWEEVKW